MESAIWRVEALAVPAWHEQCARCDCIRPHQSTECFRVNAQGSRHDIWLVYRCPRCGARRNRRIGRRLRVNDLKPGLLAAYLANDPELARLHAFELRTRQPLPYRVERPPLAHDRPIPVRIAQRFDCGVRWDRFLARELAWSRSRVAQAWRSGAIAVRGADRPSRLVRNGEEFELLGLGRIREPETPRSPPAGRVAASAVPSEPR